MGAGRLSGVGAGDAASVLSLKERRKMETISDIAFLDDMPGPLAATHMSLRHGFFTRRGGVSSGLYESLQCGYGAKDDPSENVAENRARVARWMGVAPENLVTAYQAHTAEAVRVVEAWDPADAPEADGLATATPGIALGVLAADCAPVLLEDVEAGVIGACHAGWKGALGGVLEATLAAMLELGAETARISAAIGPCIGPAAYEVGPEYAARFAEADPANARFFQRAESGDRSFFDLPGFALERLRRAGVARAEWIEACTYADPGQFFSHRRSVHERLGDYGRLISAITLPSDPEETT